MSTPTASAAPAPAPGTTSTGFTHRQILTIISGLMLGMFLAALDQNIVSTSIRTIADDLRGLNLQAWATTAYLITATISTPLYGKLSDLYGRKPFFLTAIGLFIVGSVLCTISGSMYELAIFRAVQGAGAGGLMSLALTIIGDIVPPRERARYQGYFMAVFGTSSVLGPVVGGFLAGQASILGITGWRWVFLVNVPIGIVAFAVVTRVLNLPHTRRERRIDWPGASALAVALVPILTVAEQGRSWGWTSAWSIGCYVVGALGLIGFVLAERHYGDDALLPPHLFRNGVFILTSVIAVITGIGMFGGIAIVPQYLQIVTGSTPTEGGLQMIPLVAGIMIASVVSSQLTSRTGRYKIFPVIGLGLMTVGMLLFGFLLRADTPYWETALLMVVFGLGLGNCMQTLVLAVQNAVPAKDMGVATASATFFRQMGGTLGVAVFLSVLFSTVGDSIRTALTAAAVDPAYQAALADPALRANPANAATAAQIVQDSSVLQRMDPRLAEPFLVGFADSMDLVFACAAAVIAVGFVLIWFLREVPLRTQSGIQARQAEEAGGDAAGDAAGAVPAAAPAPAVAAPAAAALAAPTSVPPPVHGALAAGGPSALIARVDAGAGRSPGAGVTLSLHDLDGAVLDHHRADDGRVTLTAPRPGTYVLIATSERHRPFADLVALDATPRHRDITLVEVGAVTGTVRAGAHPVPDATVTLTDPAGTVRAVRHTDAGGRWSIGDVEPGPWVVTVHAAGHEPAADRVHVGSAPVSHDVVLAPSRQSVSGVVTGTGDRPVPDSLVVLLASDGSVLGSSVTGPDGRFRFDGVPAGRHMLTASGFAPVSDTVVVPPSGTTRVALEVTPPRPVTQDGETPDGPGGPGRPGGADGGPDGWAAAFATDGARRSTPVAGS